jgi:hypothetical protein
MRQRRVINIAIRFVSQKRNDVNAFSPAGLFVWLLYGLNCVCSCVCFVSVCDTRLWCLSLCVCVSPRVCDGGCAHMRLKYGTESCIESYMCIFSDVAWRCCDHKLKWTVLRAHAVVCSLEAATSAVPVITLLSRNLKLNKQMSVARPCLFVWPVGTHVLNSSMIHTAERCALC